MRLTRIVAFASAAIGVAAACSTFEEAPDPGGVDDGGVEDGAAPPLEAAASDALTEDVATDDAWIPCRKRATSALPHFCDDFDRLGAPRFGWTDLLLAPDATASGDYFDESTSGPRSFRAFLPGDAAPPGRVQLQLKSNAPTKSYRLELDVRIDSIPHLTAGAGFGHFAVIEFADAPCSTGTTKARAIELSFYPTSQRTAVFVKGLSPCPGGDAAAPSSSADFAIKPIELADKTFRHASIALVKESCPNTTSMMALYVRLGDIPISMECIPIQIDAFQSPFINAYVGAYAGGAPYAPTAFIYDNVTVDTE